MWRSGAHVFGFRVLGFGFGGVFLPLAWMSSSSCILKARGWLSFPECTGKPCFFCGAGAQ